MLLVKAEITVQSLFYVNERWWSKWKKPHTHNDDDCFIVHLSLLTFRKTSDWILWGFVHSFYCHTFFLSSFHFSSRIYINLTVDRRLCRRRCENEIKRNTVTIIIVIDFPVVLIHRHTHIYTLHVSFPNIVLSMMWTILWLFDKRSPAPSSNSKRNIYFSISFSFSMSFTWTLHQITQFLRVFFFGLLFHF